MAFTRAKFEIYLGRGARDHDRARDRDRAGELSALPLILYDCQACAEGDGSAAEGSARDERGGTPYKEFSIHFTRSKILLS